MEFQLVQQAQHPTGTTGAVGACALCGEQKPPYIDASDVILKFSTANGEVITEGRLYLCVGNEERPGCVAQIVAAAGGQTPWNHAAEAERVRKVLENEDAVKTELLARQAELVRIVNRPLDQPLTQADVPRLGE